VEGSDSGQSLGTVPVLSGVAEENKRLWGWLIRGPSTEPRTSPIRVQRGANYLTSTIGKMNLGLKRTTATNDLS
jgi:hypothetical protein